MNADKAEKLFEERMGQWSDIKGISTYLYCAVAHPHIKHIVEYGSQQGFSTSILLDSSFVEVLECVDISYVQFPMERFVEAAKEKGVSFTPHLHDSTTFALPECDFLFIDAFHSGPNVEKELSQASQIRHTIAIHDTLKFGENGQCGSEGILRPINEFIEQNMDVWRVAISITKEDPDGNGLMILERMST